MFEINGKILCENCFTESSDKDSVCTYCCEAKESEKKLKVQTVLKGKYIVGMLVTSQCYYNCYLGYDIAKNRKVLIRESFQKYIMKRDGSGNVVPDCNLDVDFAVIKRQMKEKFCQEAKQMSSFASSDGILRPYDLFDEYGTTYCIIEFPVRGITLKSYVESRGVLTEQDARDIIGKIADVLQKIHSKKMFHGNLFPENIILDGDKVYLTCFHNGRYDYTDLYKSDVPYYLDAFYPHEYLSGKHTPDLRSDIFSLGMLMKFMFAECNSDEMPSFTDDTDIKAFDALPDELAEIIDKMTLPPDSRYQNMQQVKQALGCDDESQLVTVKINDESFAGVHVEEKKSNKSLKIIIALVLVFIIGIGGIFAYKQISNNQDDPEQTETTSVSSKDVEEESKKDKDNKKKSKKDKDKVSDKQEETTEKSQGDDLGTIPEQSSQQETEKQDNTIPAITGHTSPDSSQPVSGAPAFTEGKKWFENKLKSFDVSGESRATLGNDKFNKQRVVSVTFLDNLDNVSTRRSWNVSENNDGSVIAWIIRVGQTYELYIGAKDGIRASENLKSMFKNYINLEKVNFNGAFHMDYVTDVSDMFRNCPKLKEINFKDIQINSVTDLSGMFAGCTALESVDMSGFNIGSVTTTKEMFYGCKNLKSVKLSSLATFNVTDMSYMFYECESLVELDLSTFNTSNVQTMKQMFYGCKSLSKLNIKNFSVPSVTDVDGMFDFCICLKKINCNNDRIKEEFKKRSM